VTALARSAIGFCLQWSVDLAPMPTSLLLRSGTGRFSSLELPTPVDAPALFYCSDRRDNGPSKAQESCLAQDLSSTLTRVAVVHNHDDLRAGARNRPRTASQDCLRVISVSTDSEIDGAQLSEDGRLVLLKPHPTSGPPKWLLWNEADLRQEALSRLREWKIPSRYGSLIRQVESN
jgi:hypothetical protein